MENKHEKLLEDFRKVAMNGQPLTLEMIDRIAASLRYAADTKRTELAREFVPYYAELGGVK